MVLLFSAPVWAQDLDISLFDDTPNIGQNANPLDSLRITPPPAPDIRIRLDNSIPISPIPTPPEPVSPPTPSIPIDLPGTESATDVPVSSATSRPLKDASIFDVNSFDLGDTSSVVFQKAKKLGYKVLGTQENIPLFYATEYDHRCRQAGVLSPEAISKCIQDYACQEQTRYIAEAKLQRNNEYLTLYFTSHANHNELYKIVYVNKGDNSLNFTQINKMKKKQRQTEFWNAVFDKYGYPDDEKNYIWGNPRKAYMKAYMDGSAYDAYIVLENVSLSNEDYFSAADIEEERLPRNTFAF